MKRTINDLLKSSLSVSVPCLVICLNATITQFVALLLLNNCHTPLLTSHFSPLHSLPYCAGEMLNGRPVFPGTSTMNQIERVIQVTQMPSKADIEAVASPFAATMLETLPVMNYKTIPQTFPSATEDGLDVLRSCFHFNPDKRPSAEELLRHDFVSDFHNEDEEPNFPGGERKEELKF